MASEPLILSVEIDCEQKVYSLYKGLVRKGTITCLQNSNSARVLVDFGPQEQNETVSDSIDSTIFVAEKLLREYGYATPDSPIAAIGIKVAAPGSRFLTHEFITGERLKALKESQSFSDEVVDATVQEIQQLQKVFSGVPVFGVSDTVYHAHKSDAAWNYDIELAVADKYEIKRFGYNGLSNESAVQILGKHRLLEQKVVVCHLGTQYSVTGIKNGKSINTSSGFSTQEGIVQQNLSSTVSLRALRGIAHKTNASIESVLDDLCLNGGLKGISGANDTVKVLLSKEKAGDYRAKLALEMLVQSVQKYIAHMAVELGGIDQLVFTGKDGMAIPTLRKRIVDKLEFLGLAIDPTKNKVNVAPEMPAKIHQRTRVKSIYVVATDESLEIAWRTRRALAHK